MKEVRGEMWELAPQYDAVCITTNGFVKSNGEAVMGRGCAKQAARKWPKLPVVLGERIKTRGVYCAQLLRTSGFTLFSFPVKPASVIVAQDKSNIVRHMRKKFAPGQTAPGWAAVADLSIIEESARQMKLWIDSKPEYKTCILPRPGCGAGELTWEQVKPVLEKHLDDRFTVVTY